MAAAPENAPAEMPGQESRDDNKNTADFTYVTYTQKPAFTDAHRSLMSKALSGTLAKADGSGTMLDGDALWESMKDRATSGGYTFSNAIQTGVQTPHLGVGITAGDEECFELFKDIYDPVIYGWHKYSPADQHKTDLDPTHLQFSDEQAAKFDEYVVSTRIRAARNVRGFPLPPGCDDTQRVETENVLKTAFSWFGTQEPTPEGEETAVGAGFGDLKGTYYPLGELSEEDTEMLRSNGYLFQKPKTTNLLTNAGAARSWPSGRGIFHNDERTVLCWVNEEDHCRIISMIEGGNVKKAFSRFCQLSNGLKTSFEANGSSFMYDDHLGFLGTCPSNLGTGLRASVMIKLPNLNNDPERLEQICAAMQLQPRGSAGEHSAAEGGKWDVSNKQRIGLSEAELVQTMINGITKLIELEEALGRGEDISSMMVLDPAAWPKVVIDPATGNRHLSYSSSAPVQAAPAAAEGAAAEGEAKAEATAEA